MSLTILSLALMSGSPVAEIPKPPTSSPEGVITVWGNPSLEETAKAWIQNFEELHPGLKVKLNLTGSDVGMAALYTGKADVVLMGREPTASEVKAFEWIFRYRPALIPIAKGSVRTPGQSPSVTVLVHPSNPIRSLSSDQLRRVLLEIDLTWGDLGGGGAQANRPVRVYMPQAETGTGRFIRRQIVGGEIQLDWSRIAEFNGSAGFAGQDLAIVDSSLAVRGDLDGLAFGVTGIEGTQVVALPHDVQLERFVYAVVNIPPAKCLDEEVRTFLLFSTSKLGISILEHRSDFRAIPYNLKFDPSFCSSSPRQD